MQITNGLTDTMFKIKESKNEIHGQQKQNSKTLIANHLKRSQREPVV